MKKLALTVAIVFGMSMVSFAAGGGLFGQGQAVAEENSTTVMSGNRLGGVPSLPDHNQDTNQPAPLGSGIAVLVGLGAAYAAAKNRKD